MSAPPLTLADLNRMNRTGFATTLGFAFELSPWVVQRAYDAAPFDSVEALHAATMAVLEAAPEAERLALIRAHPELASKAAIDKTLTAESNAEQASAGLDKLTPEEFERFHALNAAYRERFGFPFVACVRDHGGAGLEELLAARAGAAPDDELRTALHEVSAIARHRLEDLCA